MSLSLQLATPFFRRHATILERNAVLQGALLAADGLDWRGHDAHCVLLLAVIAYWLAVLIIMLRRENRLTALDNTMLKWGFLVALLPIACAIHVVTPIAH